MIDNKTTAEQTDFFSSKRFPWYVMSAMVILTLWILFSRGMLPWCKWDSPLWLISLDAWSRHNSQHLLDPYSFSHYLHGFIFFWGLNLVLGKKLSYLWLLVIGIGIECGWELLENSPLIIDKYRANTASLEYYGDSLLNSFGDLLSCAFGFWCAAKLKFSHGLALFVLIELFTIWWIRDSLIINIIMLTFPIEAIKVWQMS